MVKPNSILDSQEVQAAYNAKHAVPPLLFAPQLFAADSMQQSASQSPISFQTSKPRLQGPVCLQTIALSDRIGHMANQWKAMGMEEIELQAMEQKKAQALQMEKLKESIENAKNRQTWQFLYTGASFIAAAVSTVLGFNMMQVDETFIVGTAMVASGALNLANTILTEAGFWDNITKKLIPDDEEYRRKVMMMIPVAITVLSLGVGVAGGLTPGLPHFQGMVSVSANLETAGESLLLKKVLSILETATLFAMGTSMIMQSRQEYKGFHLKADLNDISQEIAKSNREIEDVLDRMKHFQEMVARIFDQSKRIVHMTIEANQRAILHV